MKWGLPSWNNWCRHLKHQCSLLDNGKMQMCRYADVAMGKMRINLQRKFADVTGKMRRCGFLTYWRTTAVDDEDNARWRPCEISVLQFKLQTCIKFIVKNLSRLANNSMKGLSIPVTEGACAGKMRMFIRIFLCILPVRTSAFYPPPPPSLFCFTEVYNQCTTLAFLL